MENERITSAGANPGESRQEASLRPQHLDEYIGQQGVKENLKIFIQAAKLRHEPLDYFTVRRDSARRRWPASLLTSWMWISRSRQARLSNALAI